MRLEFIQAIHPNVMTKEQAKKATEKFLLKNEISFINVEDASETEKKVIAGSRMEQVRKIFEVPVEMEGAYYSEYWFCNIDVESGDILYLATPRGVVMAQ